MLRTFNRKIPHWELSIDCREKPITILESAQNFASNKMVNQMTFRKIDIFGCIAIISRKTS